jgi:hypothetical protein
MKAIHVPKDATEVGFTVGESTSSRVPLPTSTNSDQLYKVEAKADTWSGFKRAIGVRGVRDYEVLVERSPMQTRETIRLPSPSAEASKK